MEQTPPPPPPLAALLPANAKNLFANDDIASILFK